MLSILKHILDDDFKMVFTRLIFILLIATFTACSTIPDNSAGQGRVPAPIGNTEPVDEYKIGVDDILQVDVWRNPDLGVTVPVRPDGKIFVPLIGDVRVGGYSVLEISKVIKEKLSAFVRDPNVTVIIKELKSHEYLTRVRVTGAVNTPRSFPYRQGMTILDAVLESGGVNDFAAPNRTKIYRKNGLKTEVIDVQLGDILTQGELQTNYPLKPGDVVTVPERLF